MILPGFGIISEVLPVFARKPIFGYKAVAAATAVIAFLSLIVVGAPHVHDAEPGHRARVLHARVVPHRPSRRA
jgi:heme/copper-type cytochrome/quinol oxidase subunit 1